VQPSLVDLPLFDPLESVPIQDPTRSAHPVDELSLSESLVTGNSTALFGKDAFF
jgi:hypothetical protein